MGNKDIFAPPTEDELDLFAPPSDDELNKDMSFGEGLGREALKALPIAGSMIGGAIGGGAGLASPIIGGAALGAAGGSGLGAMAGKSLQQAGEKFFFDEGPKSRPEQYGELVSEGASGVVGEMGGQAIGPAISLAGKGIKSAAPKVGHALTGVSEQEIKTYAKNSDKIKAMARASDNSTIEAADQIRLKYAKDIQSSKGELNKTISDVLLHSEKQIDTNPIIRSLMDEQLKINPNLYPEQVAQIDDLISKIQSISKNGQVSASEGHQIKQFLQDKASSAYSNPGQIFSIGTEAARAAKSGAASARDMINIAEPSVASANKKLSELHHIEDGMNLNILHSGKPEAALMAAGTGGNPRNARALEQLGEFTGTPMLEEAQNLAAMRTFADPSIMPVDTTGKSATRLGAGALIGALGTGFSPVGMAVGSAATSPMALKGAIDLSNAVGKIAPKIPAIPMKEQLYKSIIQKKMQNNSEDPNSKPPDQTSIMERAKGSPYEQILNNALQSGGPTSFAAANYVLKNRDKKYRDLFNDEENVS